MAYINARDICTFSADCYRYERQLDRDEAIQEGAERLMATGQECDPFEPSNIAEAMACMDESRLERLSRYLNNNMREEAGNELLELLNEYWFDEALIKAEDDLDN